MEQVTAQQYAENLDDTLRDLHERLRTNAYVAPPVERGWSEKEGGQKRPRGKPGCEDTRVQRAVGMSVEAIFAEDFHAFSHGFRKGHRQPPALHERREQCRTLDSTWRVDAEGRGCFDNLAWGHLREFLQQRVSDGGILSLSGTWLPAGVLESGERTHPDKGTPHGGVIAPMFAKVFLPHVLDAWCVKDVQPRRRGRCFLRRFADDFLIGCAHETDARRVMEVLPKRFTRFGLTMHPENTALLAFKRPPSRESSRGGTGSFDLLGFPPSWGKTRQGYWVIKRKTIGKRLRRCRQGIGPWCGENRHEPVKAPSQTLGVKLRGYDHYSGIRGNFTRLEVIFEPTERAWQDWRSRRSDKSPLNWQKCAKVMRQQFPLPKPRIIHHISPG